MRRLAVPLVLCLGLVQGCSSNPQPAKQAAAAPQPAPAAAAAAPVPDFEFTPLTQQDVELYLGILREGVARFRQLPAADKAVLAQETDYYKHLKSGWHPDPTPQEKQLFGRANDLHHLDYGVAKEKGVYDRYLALSDAIEGMVGPMKCGQSDCGLGPDEDDPALRKKQIEDDKKRKVVIAQDLVVLKPHEQEIDSLVSEIRLMPEGATKKKKGSE